MRKTEDVNTRKIVVGKDCHAKYCIDCPYLVKAGWEEKQGYKHGWVGVVCCVNSGKCLDGNNMVCPHGIGWDICLGEAYDFDPELIYIPINPDINASNLPEVTNKLKRGETLD